MGVVCVYGNIHSHRVRAYCWREGEEEEGGSWRRTYSILYTSTMSSAKEAYEINKAAASKKWVVLACSVVVV